MAALSKNEVPPWGLAVAGSTGAIIANALVYPLDIVKTRLQVQVKRHPGDPGYSSKEDPHYTGTMHAILSIIEDEGLHGLYSGLFGSLIGVASTNFAYFYWYSTVRELYISKVQKTSAHPSTAVELSLGAVAGALAQLFTIPVAVVTTRQQTQPKAQKKGMFATGKEVIEGEDGITGLWRGLKASLILVINPAITYGAYQRLREVIFPNKVNLRPHEAFRKFIGAKTSRRTFADDVGKFSERSPKPWQQLPLNLLLSPKSVSSLALLRRGKANHSNLSSRSWSISSKKKVR